MCDDVVVRIKRDEYRANRKLIKRNLIFFVYLFFIYSIPFKFHVDARWLRFLHSAQIPIKFLLCGVGDLGPMVGEYVCRQF